MPLPLVPTRRDTVMIGDEKVEVRGLTRAESYEVQRLTKTDVGKAEAVMIAHGTDTPLAEVQDWLRDVPSEAAGLLADAIVELSGLGEQGARKSS